jgi:hypothetical protein
VETQLAVHVLIHRGEQCKPSSTGRLIARAVAGAACHVFQRATRFHPAAGFAADSVEPGRELWILHPGGDPMPEPVAATAGGQYTGTTVLLLDGTWRQAGEMLRDDCGCTSNCTSTRRSSPAVAGRWRSATSDIHRCSPRRRMHSPSCTPGRHANSILFLARRAADGGIVASVS